MLLVSILIQCYAFLLSVTLLQAFCFSFYGCVLWDLLNKLMIFVCVRKGLKRSWSLPANAYSHLVGIISYLFIWKFNVVHFCLLINVLSVIAFWLIMLLDMEFIMVKCILQLAEMLCSALTLLVCHCVINYM